MAGSREKSAALAAAGTAAAAAAGLGIKRLRDGHGKTFDSDAYRLLAGEPVGAGVKRILAAQVDDAIAQLRGEAGNEPGGGDPRGSQGREEDPLGAAAGAGRDRR